MSSLLDKIGRRLASPGLETRRSVLRNAIRASAALAGVVAGVRIPTVAYAANYHCCTLAFYPTFCKCPYCTVRGSSDWYWTCNDNGNIRVCGECYTQRCSYSYLDCCFPCNPGCMC